MRTRTEFKSGFSEDIQNMLSFRKASGFSIETPSFTMKQFDQFASEYFPKESVLTEKVVKQWLEWEVKNGYTGINGKISDIRYFAKYLNSIGKSAYMMSTAYRVKYNRVIPYLPSDDEIGKLFYSIDNYDCSGNRCKHRFFMKQVAPVYFRLLYSCGLRPQEGTNLKIQDVDFDNCRIFLRKTKKNKERIVVVNQEMMDMIKSLAIITKTVFPDAEYVFVDGYTSEKCSIEIIEQHLMRCWKLAFPEKARNDIPILRPYTLRHLYATTRLHDWIDEGKNIYAMMPYLRIYMGHTHIDDTLYYIHLLPERLIKTATYSWNDMTNTVIDGDKPNEQL